MDLGSPTFPSGAGGGGSSTITSLLGLTNAGQQVMASSLPVVIASDNTGPVEVWDGTNTANILKSDGTAAGQNAVMVGGGIQTQTYSLSAAGDTSVFTCTGYGYVTVRINSNLSGGLTQFKISSDNSNFDLIQLGAQDFSDLSATPGNTGKSYSGSLMGAHQFKVTVTGSSGTAAGTITFSTLPLAPQAVWAIQKTSPWLVGSATLSDTGTITTNASSIIASSIQSFESGFIPITIHGTYAGVQFTITVSDDGGTTYYNVPVYDINANCWRLPGATLIPGTNASNVYYIPNIPNNTNVKVLASAYSSGTANVRIGGGSSSNTMPGSTMSQIMDAAGNNRGANVSSNNALNVDAPTATGSAVPANAFFAGGKASNSAPVAGSDGNLTGLWVGRNGQPFVALTRDDGTKISSLDGSADGQSTGNVAIQVGDYPFVFNGTNWDRLRSGGVTGAVMVSGDTATGSAVPGHAFYLGAKNFDGTLVGLSNTSNVTGVALAVPLGVGMYLYNGSTADIWKSGGVTGMAGVSGDTASGSTDGGNPLKTGGLARSSEPTAVTSGQRVGATFDLVGKQIVMPYANKENFVSGTANTTGTSDTAVIAAQGAGLFIYITTITVVNTGSNASLVTIETDTASAKTAIWQVIAPAGGGTVVTFPTPIKGSVANKNVGFICGTGSTTIYCSLAGYAGT